MGKTFEFEGEQDQYPSCYSNASEWEREEYRRDIINSNLNLSLKEKAQRYLKKRSLELIVLLLLPA